MHVAVHHMPHLADDLAPLLHSFDASSNDLKAGPLSSILCPTCLHQPNVAPEAYQRQHAGNVYTARLTRGLPRPMPVLGPSHMRICSPGGCLHRHSVCRTISWGDARQSLHDARLAVHLAWRFLCCCNLHVLLLVPGGKTSSAGTSGLAPLITSKTTYSQDTRQQKLC